MSRTLSLAILVGALLLALARAVAAHDFSVDPTSPEVLQFRYGSSDIVDQTGGGPIIFASQLGIGTDELDGFSYGKDLLRPVGGPNFFVSLQFSVSRATLGAGQVVTTQRNLNGAAGDKFNMLILRNGRTVGPFLESDAPNHHLTPGAGSAPGQSEIDGLSFPSGSKPNVYYTVARGGVKAPSDVWVVDWTQATAPVLFATAAQLGLLATDNIDAIAIKDGGIIGALDSADLVYVSLDNTSPTRIARGGQDDILQVWPGAIAVAIPFNKLDIQGTLNEEIDAITGYDPGPIIHAAFLTATSGFKAVELNPDGLGNVFALITNETANTAELFQITALGFLPLASLPIPAGFRTFGQHAIYNAAGDEWFVKLIEIATNALYITRYKANPSTPGGWDIAHSLVEGSAISGWPYALANIDNCYGYQSWTGQTCVGALAQDTNFTNLHIGSCMRPNGTFPQPALLAASGVAIPGVGTLNLGRVHTNPTPTVEAIAYGTGSTGPLLYKMPADWDSTLERYFTGTGQILFNGMLPGSGAVGSYSDVRAGSEAFIASSGGVTGVYRRNANATITKIADTNSPVPRGFGNFTFFLAPLAFDEESVSFAAFTADGPAAFSDRTGRFQKIVGAGDVIDGRTVQSVGFSPDSAAEDVIALAVLFTDGTSNVIAKRLPKPFDTTDATQRAIHLDIELDPNPAILGPNPPALLLGDLGTARLRGIWKSNGITGTVTIPGSEVARLLALQFGPATAGGIGEWVITVDVASGAILSSAAKGTLANGPFDLNADTNGGPWTSPLIPGGIAGSQAGFETNVGGQSLFCSNAFSQIGGAACDTGAFGSPAASAYDPTSGFVHMTGPLTLGNVVLWGFLGDQRWLEAPASQCPDIDSDGVCDSTDNCVYEPNSGQQDIGGVGAASGPNGSGDACECGDVSSNGRVTSADATLITRNLLVPPTATLAAPDKCNVGGSAGCTSADAVIATRSLLVPPTASILPACAAKTP